mgnify:CR=1 FL=1
MHAHQKQLETCMLNLLKNLTLGLTGQEIPIEEKEVEGVMVYTIKAPKEVMGILIGKSGKTIRAIRNVAKARAIIDQTRISIDLEEAV